MITRDRRWMDDLHLDRVLGGAVKEFRRGLYRLERLHRYQQGKHDILSRERQEGLPNARLPHGFARYIAQVSAGHLLAGPVRYTDGEHAPGVKALRALYEQAEAGQADVELAMQQAVYGRGVSLNYLDGQGTMKVAALDPRSAFVVYDDTVERQPLMGVLLSQERDAQGRPAGGSATVYLPRRSLRWRLNASGDPTGAPTALPHAFGRVPMAEYLNNEAGRGDFEDVLPLIDAYDRLSSDRLNDRAQFADAMLVLTGVMGLGTADDPEDHQAAMRRLRQNRTLTLPDGDARAEWLVKNPLEKDIDVLRRALAQDIHKFSMTPDFSDERFAGNASGIAIRYKLFCLEQKTRLKERWFVAGLRERARITAGWMRKQGLPPIDPERLRIHLARETYQDDNGKETHGTSTADPPGKPGAAGDPGPDR